MKKLSALWTLLIAAVLLCGCGKNENVPLQELSVFQGDEQCAFPGTEFAKPLYILAAGKPAEGMFSSKEPPPASGTKIRFEAAPGSDLKISPSEAVADAGGLVRVSVKAGKKVGDQYLKVIPVDAPDKELLVRFISGIRITGGNQEIRAGSQSAEPLAVEVVDANGRPSAGVPVFFRIANTPSGGSSAALSEAAVLTDAAGRASTTVLMGKATGKYDVNIEVAGTRMTRGIVVRELGINFVAMLMNVFGGLAVFVFGMKLMSDGLDKAAGEKMRSILHLFSSNRYVAVLAGAVVTAVIQSSSASTVMVIGFVNAGLLTLVQSIGIIFGANIGTTITAQIIAFDVTSITMPAIIIGLLMLFISWKYLRGWGETVLGFGLLFFGMTLMSSELKSIADFPTFIRFFSSFDCAPVNGWMPPGALLGAIGIGLAVTMIVQSSSAATGIILALGASGLINLYTAVALVLGSNIGTTVTAQLAAIPTNRIAKQAALAHTMFNCIGVLLIGATFYIRWGDSGVPVFFYLIDSITTGDAFAAIPQNVPRHIANAHTVFNVITTLVLLPFTTGLARFCEWMIPVKKETLKFQHLEPHLLDNPSIALEQAAICYGGMLRESWSMISQAVEDHFVKCEITEEETAEFEKREKNIDNLQFEITNYLIQVTRHGLSQKQAEYIPVLMHCTNDAERIADHTENILSLTKRLQDADARLSEAALSDLDVMYSLLKRQADDVLAALKSHDAELSRRGKSAEKEILRLAEELENKHIERLREGTCNAIVGVIFIELLGDLTKVSGKFANIAKRAPRVQKYYQDLNLPA